DVAVHGDVQPGAAAQVCGLDVDLRRRDVVRQERVVREVSADEDEQVGILHRVLAGAVPEQAGHTDVVRVLVLDDLLPAQRVPHRGGGEVGQLEHLLPRVPRAGADEERDLLGPVDGLGERGDVLVVRHDPGRARAGDENGLVVVADVLVGDVTGKGEHRDTGRGERVLDRGPGDPRDLLG